MKGNSKATTATPDDDDSSFFFDLQRQANGLSREEQ
jgi:hypothetical protein